MQGRVSGEWPGVKKELTELLAMMEGARMVLDDPAILQWGYNGDSMGWWADGVWAGPDRDAALLMIGKA